MKNELKFPVTFAVTLVTFVSKVALPPAVTSSRLPVTCPVRESNVMLLDASSVMFSLLPAVIPPGPAIVPLAVMLIAPLAVVTLLESINRSSTSVIVSEPIPVMFAARLLTFVSRAELFRAVTVSRLPLT